MALLDHPLSDLRQTVAALERKLEERTAERDDALAQQTATSGILHVIARWPTDVQPVFEAIVASAARVCEAEFSAVARFKDGLLHLVAIHSMSPEETAAFHSLFPRSPARNFLMGRAFLDGRPVHFEDVLTEPDYDVRTREVLQSVARYRSLLGVPILREGRPIGVIFCGRREVKPFTASQIELVKSFADQAAIAIENVRLFGELEARNRDLGEALDQQTATAEVLQAINNSPGQLAPVFESLLEKSLRLCEAAFGLLIIWDGEQFHRVAFRGVPAELVEAMRQPLKPVPGGFADRLVCGERVIVVPDLVDAANQAIGPGAQLLVRSGARSYIGVALRRDEALLGAIVIYRREVRPFTDKQIALLENFAAQAVIAMENARLITETREALEQQTATAEVLQVINSSPGDLAPVFEAMLEKALRLCNAAFGCLWTYDGERIHAAAVRSAPPDFAEFLTRAPHAVGPDNAHGRLLSGDPVVHIADVTDDVAYQTGDPVRRNLVERGGGRTLLAVPLLKDERFLGDFVIYRQEVRPFTDKQIALLQNFAAQAVIAMENARLLTETREALEQQTATAEVLQVINSSPGDLAPVFEALLDKAMQLCQAAFGGLWTFDGNRYVASALRGVPAEYAEFLAETTLIPGPGSAPYRFLRGERSVLHNVDLASEEPYRTGDPQRRALVELGRARTALQVPLCRDDAVLGVITIYRQEVRPFSEKQSALLQNFAAQAVIAMENARLLDGIRTARDTAESALHDLKVAQAKLIHTEKLASLGQLTAGIAHEIKNPLNFVNNFAGLSVELLDELKEAAAPAITSFGDDTRAEIDEIVGMLTGNLEKIAEHGRRADGIVKSMLAHSRGGSGERQAVDINSLVDESLNLAYHGARAQDQNFNIVLERDLDRSITPIELVPQDVTRVFLNLFGNGFYAANQRCTAGNDRDFRPSLKVTTRDFGAEVEIRVRDNGTGIPPEVRDKLFQPFFTTKPTGEGTGLGLSISYDIVTQQHGGTITVDSRVGEFTEFTIRLPRSR